MWATPGVRGRSGPRWRQQPQQQRKDRNMAVSIEQVRKAKGIVDTWLIEHLALFNPYQWRSGAELLFRRKCFNELAFYLLWRSRLEQPATPELARMQDFVNSQLSDDYLSLAARDSARLVMFLGALSYAGHVGRFDQERQRFVRSLLAGPFAWSVDGSAFRHMELLTACRFNGADAMVTAQQVFATSSLALPPSPIHGTRAAFYTLTHAAFYQFLLQEPVADAGELLSSALKGGLCRAIAADDKDLCMELLATNVLLRRPVEAEAVIVLETMVSDLLQRGVIDTPIESEVVSAFIEKVPAQADWASRVHLMMVAGIALTVVERHCLEAELDASAASRRFSIQLGKALHLLHKHRLAQGLHELADVCSRSASENRELDAIAEFVSLNRRPDGQYGHVVDELALHRARTADSASPPPLTNSADAACRQFLLDNAHRASPANCHFP